NMSGPLSLVFAGPGTSLYGSVPTVEGVSVGSSTSVTFASGAASNLSFVPTKAESFALSAGGSGIATITNLQAFVEHTSYSPAGGYLEADVGGAVLGQPISNRVWARDVYGNNVVSNLPTFVFLRYDKAGAISDFTLAQVASNLYGSNVTPTTGSGKYTISSYFNGITESDRVKRDNSGTSDGWITMDLYDVPSTNIDNLLDMPVNKGGIVLTQNPVTSGMPVGIYGKFSRGSQLKIIIHGLDGMIVYASANTTVDTDGLQVITWNGRDKSGAVVVPGLYFIMAQIVEPNGTKREKYFKMVIQR
ncbi:MAG: hypothetical protein JNM63_14125, partial [Spirochaetia bacterium]|nr:hypothetical protein [Spirochaetia bacterium]